MSNHPYPTESRHRLEGITPWKQDGFHPRQPMNVKSMNMLNICLINKGENEGRENSNICLNFCSMLF